MRRLFLLVPFVLAACAQDIGIAPKDSDVPVPADTDVALPALQPDIEVTPSSLSFGSLPPHCAADDQEVTVANVGEAPLNVTSLALDGAGNSAFTLNKAGPFHIAPGESIKFKVGFEAGDYVVYDKVKVVVASNDPDEKTVKVGVAGEGANAAFKDELFIQESASAVDVLWIIDNSGSMSDTIRQLGNAMNTFINSFVNLGMDYQIAVVTTDMANPAESGHFMGPIIKSSTFAPADAVNEFRAQTSQGFSGSPDEMGLSASMAALSAPLSTGSNAGLIRSNATLAVVVISDEEDSSDYGPPTYPNDFPTNPAPYITWLKSLKSNPDDVTFSGMVGPKSGSCGGAIQLVSAAPRYHQVINGTNGVWSNICQLDINPFLTHLSYVAAGLEFRFPLSDTPVNTSPAAITVTVDGVAVPYGAINGWTYDAANNSIQLHGDAIADPGEAIVINYPYDSGCGNP